MGWEQPVDLREDLKAGGNGEIHMVVEGEGMAAQAEAVVRAAMRLVERGEGIGGLRVGDEVATPVGMTRVVGVSPRRVEFQVDWPVETKIAVRFKVKR